MGIGATILYLVFLSSSNPSIASIGIEATILYLVFLSSSNGINQDNNSISVLGSIESSLGDNDDSVSFFIGLG